MQMTYMKKTNWLKIILIVLSACIIGGLILTVVLFIRDPDRTSASARLQFSFNGAGEGKAPNGYPFDVNGIFTEEVLANALEASGLIDTYTIEQIRDNLTITGIYPEDIVKQMTVYNSLLDKNAEQQASITDYHATLFRVTLYHDFDPGITKAQLTNLLNNLLTAYRSYFIKTYAYDLVETNPIMGLSEYDYSQQLLVISESADQQNRFAQEMADLAPDFRKDRKGFDDIVVAYSNLKSDIDRLQASIILNTISKDRGRLQKQYEMELRTLGRELEAIQEELTDIEKLVSSYEKDSIVYVSTSGSLQKVSSNASDTYDKLVVKRKKLTDRIAAINADIARYQALLNDMINNNETAREESDQQMENPINTDDTEDTVSTAVEVTEEELKHLATLASQRIEVLLAKKEKISSEFNVLLDTYAQQEINEQTMMISGIEYKTPSLLSGAFVKKAIKTVGVICTIGFMICLILLINSRRKEGK